MKRILLILAVLVIPTHAHAMSWGWVPKVFQFEEYRGKELVNRPGLRCKVHNAWGDCVVYSVAKHIRPQKHSYYRRVSSFGAWNKALNYSDCALDDYHRHTAVRSQFQRCE